MSRDLLAAEGRHWRMGRRSPLHAQGTFFFFDDVLRRCVRRLFTKCGCRFDGRSFLDLSRCHIFVWHDRLRLLLYMHEAYVVPYTWHQVPGRIEYNTYFEVLAMYTAVPGRLGVVLSTDMVDHWPTACPEGHWSLSVKRSGGLSWKLETTSDGPKH